MQPSNYPPGVTGNEPEITGDPPRWQAPPKFRRGPAPAETERDSRGPVAIRVYRINPKNGRAIYKQPVRLISVADSTVDMVAATIEEALFGPPNDEED